MTVLLVVMTFNRLAMAVGMSEERAFKWLPHVLESATKYQFTEPKRMAMWIAQCGHESNGFNDLSENLNYSASALRKLWPKRFPTDEIANAYARQPEKIANRAYADRMGNGPEDSGDGWRFRGRGLIQLTGRDCYTAFTAALGVDCINHPSLLSDPRWAALSAGWFWETRKLNVLSDRCDIMAVTKAINGGSHGIIDRQRRYDRALKIVANSIISDVEPTHI